MKKNYVLYGLACALFYLIGIGQAQAQNLNPGPHFGIKGGLNLSQLFVDQPNVQDENIKAGLHFGVFSKIPITNNLALQPELLYTNQGSRVNYGQSTIEDLLGIEPGEVRYNLNYIQLPVALAINLGPLNIHAGPYLSYLVSANITDLNATDLSTNQLVDLNEDDFHRWDYGVLVGVGVDIQNISLGVRYNHGLKEVGNTNLAGALTNNSRNAVGQIYIGFGF